MEKTDEAIIAEIKDSIALLRRELDNIESRLTELCPSEPAIEPVSASEDEPFDIMLDDPQPVPPEPVVEPELENDVPEIDTETEFNLISEPVDDREVKPEPVPEPEPVQHKKVLFESVMPDSMPWKRDIPGPKVQNILSAISLNDRVLFINSLFNGDPLKFQDTIRIFNQCTSLAEAEHYIVDNFPKWNMNSDVIYRFMMAVRRKLS